MNLDEVHRQLIAAARGNPPRDTVPYAFAERITARLQARPAMDEWAQWAQALWRAAAPCVAVSLLLGAWVEIRSPANSSTADVSQLFENTVLAAADQESTPTDLLW